MTESPLTSSSSQRSGMIPYPPRIVVLDGFTMNPGDLSWEALSTLGDVVRYDRSLPSEVVPRTRGFHIAVTNKESFDRGAMEQLPDLRMIAITATGHDRIDIPAARETGITVCNVPAYSTESVAEHVFALLLAVARRAEWHDRLVRQGDWIRCPDFCFYAAPQHEWAGQSLGVVGWGQIGQHVGQ
ncbi:MAG TPA: NAD(P)-dependent oxidoreductase, partial [Pirellulaceae bacterium]